MSDLSEAIIELLQAQSWPEVVDALNAHPDLQSEDAESLLSALIQTPEASDYEITMLEDLRNLIFENGSDPVAATYRRTDLHWARALELFGPRIDSALSLFQQYQTSADLDLLDKAQRRWDGLLADPRLTSAPPGFQLYVSDGLTAVRLSKYAALGDQNDLEAGLKALREALDNTADTSRLRPRRLTNYAAALLQRFHVTENTADLTDGLEASRQALAATDPTDPLWPGRANNLAAALVTRFENSYGLADLDDAVRVYDGALALAPEKSPARASLLHGKGSALQRRHALDDDIGSLEASIRYFGEAVSIAEGLPERALFLGDLGIALGIRFEELGDVSDLDHSIDRLSEAVEWATAGPELTRRNAGALAIARRTRYERFGALDDLRHAAVALRTAWRHTDPADAGYSEALETYGTCLQRFVNELTSALESTPDSRELRSQLGQALWELYEITRSETVRDRALEHIRGTDGTLPGTEGLYCNSVLRLIDEIIEAMLSLYGRDLYNTFDRLGRFLQEELYALINDGHMDTDMQAKQQPDQVLLPGLSFLVTRHIRYAWDYFVFIYMSHKIKNIKRRQLARGSLDLSILLYLRGADYQLAISREGAGVGLNTTQDMNFHSAILSDLAHQFDVVQAMSPSNLNLAMKDLGFFLGSHGNYLSSTAEFARAYDAGIFLNPVSWRASVLDLLPSASFFIVYVSNQSNGLMYELESLAARKLEDHAILVLDENRFGSRESFFAAQARLNKMGVHVYESVIRDLSAVDDPDAFERLVDRFPHAVTLREDSAAVRRDIEALIPIVRRSKVEPPAEIPFEFHVNLDAVHAKGAAKLRHRVADFIQTALSQETVPNWPVLVLYLEMDIFLSLAFGEVLDAALSTTRYAAVADFMRTHLSESATADVLSDLEQCGNLAMNIGYDAFAIGEWNDYSDRREVSHELVDAAAKDLADLMRRSVDGDERCLVYEAEHHLPHIDPQVHAQLLEDALYQFVPSDGRTNDSSE